MALKQDVLVARDRGLRFFRYVRTIAARFFFALVLGQVFA